MSREGLTPERKTRMQDLYDRLVNEGYSPKEYAEENNLSVRTVQRDLKYMREHKDWRNE